MATITNTSLVDDIDGGDAVETIAFALDGRAYTIDLNAENATRIRDDIGAWTESARPVNARSRKARVKEATAARAWLRDHGYDIGDRGRIPAELMTIYRAS